MIIVTTVYYEGKNRNNRRQESFEIDADDMIVTPGANIGEAVLTLNKRGKPVAIFNNWDTAVQVDDGEVNVSKEVLEKVDEALKTYPEGWTTYKERHGRKEEPDVA